jgi:hypothetical protein
MNRLPRTALVLPLVAALAACGGVPKVLSRNADFGNAEMFVAGETRTYDDGLAVTLDRVDDSRCKPDVQCIWAGELAPVLTLRGGSLAGAQTVSLGSTRTPRAQVGPYGIALDSATERSARIIITR